MRVNVAPRQNVFADKSEAGDERMSAVVVKLEAVRLHSCMRLKLLILKLYVIVSREFFLPDVGHLELYVKD